MTSLECIQDWELVSKNINKRYGTPKSLEELAMCTQKVIKEKKWPTPFMRGLLTKNHRIFREAKILPNKLSKTFGTEKTVNDALKAGYLEFLLLDEKVIGNGDIQYSNRIHGTTNLILMR